MPQNLQTLTPLLKEIYEGGLNKQLNNEVKAWNRVKSVAKNSDKMGGKYVNFPIHISRNSGIGSRRENEALPEAGAQGFEEAMLPWRYHYASVQLTGQAIELANTDYQSFASALTTEMSAIKDDLSKERNRQFFGDGLGTRTITTGAPSGQVIPVADARQLELNGIYDVMVGATNVVRQTVTITNYDYTAGANKVTVSGTVTGITTNDIWVRKGSYDREIHGIASIISDSTTLYGINPATVPVWKAEVKTHGSATAISELMMTRMADRIYRNGGKTTVMWTTLEILRAYFALLASNRRFTNTQKFEGGHSGVAFQSPTGGEVPFLADIDAPVGEINYLNEKELTYYSRHDGFKFMDRSGSMWTQKRDVNGKYDAWDATLYEYSELATTRRNTHGKITNVLGDTE